jgi:hypothetical protein
MHTDPNTNRDCGTGSDPNADNNWPAPRRNTNSNPNANRDCGTGSDPNADNCGML